MKLLLSPVFLLKRTINLQTQRERLTFLRLRYYVVNDKFFLAAWIIKYANAQTN